MRFRREFFALCCLLSIPSVGIAGESRSSQDMASALDFANGLYARRMYAPAISEYEKFIHSFPHSPDVASAHFRLADAYYFSKNYRAAEREFRYFLEKFPQEKRTAMARFRIASAFYFMEQPSRAIPAFERLLKETPDDPAIQSGTRFYLGKMYLSAKNSEKALMMFEEILHGTPDSEYAAYAAMTLGAYYWKENNFQKAIESYAVASQKAEGILFAKDALLKMAQIQFSQGVFADARPNFDKVFTADADKTVPESDRAGIIELRKSALLGIFYCDLNMEDRTDALSRADKEKTFIAENHLGSEVAWVLALLHIKLKQTAPATAYLDAVIADDGASVDMKEKAFFKKAELWSQDGHKEEALGLLQSAVDTKPRIKGQAQFEKMKLLKDLGRWADALAVFEGLSEKDFPDVFKKALYEKAEIYLQTNEPSKAQEVFEDYIHRFPQDPGSEAALLEIMEIQLDGRKFEEGLRTVDRFFKEYPQSRYQDLAIYKAGIIWAGLKNYDNAAKAFQKVLMMTPASEIYPESLFGLATSFQNLGRTDEAIRAFEKLLSRFPKHALCQEVYSHLSVLYIKTNRLKKLGEFYEYIYFNRPEISMGLESVWWLIQYDLDSHQYEKMKPVLDALPSHFPGQNLDHEINFFLGESFMGAKDTAKALEYYQKAVAAKPEGPYTPYAYLGMGIASEDMKDFASSEKYLKEALRFDDETKVTSRARFEIANLYLRANNLAEAAKAFMRVAILFDDAKYTPLSLYKGGMCFLKIGQHAEALEAFRELQERYPNSEWAKKVVHWLPADSKSVPAASHA